MNQREYSVDPIAGSICPLCVPDMYTRLKSGKEPELERRPHHAPCAHLDWKTGTLHIGPLEENES
jgi:hypothetical protein